MLEISMSSSFEFQYSLPILKVLTGIGAQSIWFGCVDFLMAQEPLLLPMAI
jgi:hypothetical protein